MNYLILVLAFTVYVGSAFLSYGWKTSPWFWPLGIAIGVMTTGLWFWLAQRTPSHKELMVLSLAWDLGMTAIYLGVAVAFFGVRMSGLSLAGFLICVVGLVMLKIAGAA